MLQRRKASRTVKVPQTINESHETHRVHERDFFWLKSDDVMWKVMTFIWSRFVVLRSANASLRRYTKALKRENWILCRLIYYKHARALSAITSWWVIKKRKFKFECFRRFYSRFTRLTCNTLRRSRAGRRRRSACDFSCRASTSVAVRSWTAAVSSFSAAQHR